MCPNPAKSIALSLALLFLLPCVAPVRAAASAKARATADLIFEGSVWVDGEPVTPGVTLFAGNMTRTGETSWALINLGASGMVRVYEGSEVRWEADDCGFLLRLKAGKLRIYSPPGVVAKVVTPDGEVRTNGEAPSVFYVESDGTDAAVEPESGLVDFVTAGGTTTLSADEGAAALQDTTTGQGKSKKKKRLTLASLAAAAVTTAVIVGTGGGGALALLPIIAPSPSN